MIQTKQKNSELEIKIIFRLCKMGYVDSNLEG